MAKKRRRTILGTLIAMGLAVGISFNSNVRNVFTSGPDTLNFDGVLITEAQWATLSESGVPDSILAALVALSAEDPGPSPEVEALREEIRNVGTLVARLSENVQELARAVALEPLPAVYLVAGDTLAVADSARTRWVWEHWRGAPRRSE